MSTHDEIYSPKAVAEVRGNVRRFETRLSGELEPWLRTDLEHTLADARAWLQEASRG